MRGRSERAKQKAVEQIEKSFPSPEPEKHRYLVETDKFNFYLLDYRPSDEGDGWIKVPIAKFSYNELDKMWQLSFMPPQGRWQKFGKYYDIETATLVIKGDPTGCFRGSVSPLSYLKHGKTVQEKDG